MKQSRAQHQSVGLSELRTHLAKGPKERFWRSLDEAGETELWRRTAKEEFPSERSLPGEHLSRREFLQLASACAALSALPGCTKQPVEPILPYVRQPELLVPGEPLFYATTMTLGGFGTGVLVKSREGHPIKVEGNPDHPSSLGGSNVWIQASILDLYDPERSQNLLQGGRISTWQQFASEMLQVAREQSASKGAGMRLLTETVTSPTLAGQLRDLLHRFPQAKWHQFDPVSRDNVRAGARSAFGKVVETHHRFDRAEVILSLDADFLYSHPAALRYAREFANGRRIAAGQRKMNRLYVVESSPSVTGTMADHRLPLSGKEIELIAWHLARRLGLPSGGHLEELPVHQAAWLDIVASDLEEHRGSSVVIAGPSTPVAIQVLTHLFNERLENVGKTVYYTEPAEAEPVQQLDSLRELVSDMETGRVQTLLILGVNPVYSAPVDFKFREQLAKVQRSIHLGSECDETGVSCTWHVPQTHYLEAWGDARAFDGTISFVQPLVSPLFGGKSSHEILDLLTQTGPARSDYEIVRDYWLTQNVWDDFERGWRRCLHDGVVNGTALPPVEVSVQTGVLPEAFLQPRSSRIELAFGPDPHLWDGRFANNGWLQECPKPISKITWDNAVLISPKLAEEMGLATDDVVELEMEGRKLEAPVWVQPGQAPQTLTLHLGYGRSETGRVGQGVGFNANLLRSSTSFWASAAVQIRRTEHRHRLIATQLHQSIDAPERQVLRAGTWRQYESKPEFVREESERPAPGETLYDSQEYRYEGYKWGMSIDVNTCIGCNACLVACEVENNIPFVGRAQVSQNREMFWIRVDTYHAGALDAPEFNHVPVPCMHCEHAPCELVCPVAATVHDHEGLNLQIYNRCVGTRFCSNNCPYKVRRFNFLDYTTERARRTEPLHNPEVTVRSRGVMEKCTYCVQRIAAARIAAEKENRPIRDGEVRTACEQACPAEAIVFGNLNDPESRVLRMKNQPLDYSMLGQLNTRPRTTYSAKLRNPHRELSARSAGETAISDGRPRLSNLQ